MKKAKYLLMIVMLCFTLASCHSDDPDAGKLTTTINEALISPNVPEQGWTSDAREGVLKYSPDDYESGEANGYFAFEMRNGLCEEAVYNVVMPDPLSAKILAEQLNTGTWIQDNDFITRASGCKVICNLSQNILQTLNPTNLTRASLTLPIPVSRSGRVLYVSIPNIKGLSETDLYEIMDVWCGNVYDIPRHVMFGKYENGVYTCSNMRGLGMDYEIETEYNQSGCCVLYRTMITLPTKGWAELIYSEYEDQMWDFEQQFGDRPKLSIEGNTVIMDALILGDLYKSDVDTLIYSIDWLNNAPFLFNLFS